MTIFERFSRMTVVTDCIRVFYVKSWFNFLISLIFESLPNNRYEMSGLKTLKAWDICVVVEPATGGDRRDPVWGPERRF